MNFVGNRKKVLNLFGGVGLALTTAALSGCSVNPATGEQSFTGFMSPADEKRIGSQEHPKILKQFSGAYKDPVITAYVNNIGNKLAQKSEMPNIGWTFTVLNSDQINAFALPGGYVYVTRGLMALAGNEAELAGVMAHEIGHVTARHTAQRYGGSILTGVGSLAAGILLGGAAGDLANVLSHAALQSYSRNQEFEADSLGVRYLSRGNYTTKAMASFLSKLRRHSQLQAKLQGKNKQSVDQVSMLSTHPRTLERVQRVIQRAAGSKSGTFTGPVEYLEKLHGLMFGDDPVQGFIRGTAFIHPKMRFRFDVPDGFRLFNSPSAVVARGPAGSIIQFDTARKPYNGRLTAYIQNVWMRKLRISGLETITVNGRPGATGSARLRRNGKAIDLRFVATRGQGERIYRLLFLTPSHLTNKLSLGLRQTTFSLRDISEAEAARYKPQRLAVKPVKAGDTVASFTSRMPFRDFREERFRVLNGLDPQDGLRTGQLVKTVVE